MKAEIHRLLKADLYAKVAAIFCACAFIPMHVVAEEARLPAVVVISTTLLPGFGTPMQSTPATIQAVSGTDLNKTHQNSLTDYFEQNSNDVTINAAQGNPFQPSVNFRGFTASPLLGLPQGLSVFQDGVRINEAFGDVVNWDLLAPSAISAIQITSGSNPIFGLNTLGGAIAVYTKSGLESPGGAVEISSGSFGRKTLEAEHGGKNGAWDYFFTGNFINDDGWAAHNQSKVNQLFGKLGYTDRATRLDVALSAADNTLEGTQTQPQSFSNNIRQGDTYPDRTTNQLAFLTITASHYLDDATLLSGNLYYRKQNNTSLSSNINDQYGQVVPNTGLPNLLQAANNRANINQDTVGFGMQLTSNGDISGKKNQLTLGASGDFGSTKFIQDSANAAFAADRATVNTGSFVQDTNAQTRNQYYGLYFSDLLEFAEQWSVTMSGRYNLAKVQIADQSGKTPELNGQHSFSRLNPAIGVNFNPTSRVTVFGSYNEGMRAPTPMELTCADPAAPCKLPNSFVSDPPLKKVVAKTFELGARGKPNERSHWNAAIYRTDLIDDIQFISSSGAAANTGFFQNVGNTRRQGVELAARASLGAIGVSAQYSFIDATYRSEFAERSPNNSTANANGTVLVSPGNHIPGIPRHSIKLRFDYEIAERASTGINVIYGGGFYARGDENNQDVNGKIPSYTVINLDAQFKILKSLQLFARVNNLFDKQYANFGVLGQNFFNGPNNSFNGNSPATEQFRGYGAPRGAWVGLRYLWM